MSVTTQINKLLCPLRDHTIDMQIIKDINIKNIMFIKEWEVGSNEAKLEVGSNKSNFKVYYLSMYNYSLRDRQTCLNDQHEQDDRRILFTDCSWCLKYYIDIMHYLFQYYPIRTIILPNKDASFYPYFVNNIHICNKANMIAFVNIFIEDSDIETAIQYIHNIFPVTTKSAK